MIKATILGEELEIWFTPSFNIKTTDKRIERILRTLEVNVFDHWETRMRRVKATKGEKEAFLVLLELSYKLPEFKIKITKAPELPLAQNDDKEEELLY